VTAEDEPFSIFTAMIRTEAPTQPPVEPAAGRPEASAEQWLGRNASSKRRLWERLNPRHRKTLRLLAQAFAMRQSQARLPDEPRAKLLAALEELERLTARIEKLLASIATRTPPPG